MECLISLVVTVKKDFNPYVSKFIPTLLKAEVNLVQSAKADFNSRKNAIDLVSALTRILPASISPLKP